MRREIFASREETTTGTPFTFHCQLVREIDSLVHAAHGSVFDTITTGTFAASKVVLPSISAARAFEGIVRPWFDRVLADVRESQTLASLRDTLLPKLISGELRVKDAEKIAERAL